MFKKTITIALGVALFSGIALTNPATADVLDRDATRALFTGATGTHWYLNNEKWYQLNWQSNGNLTVTNVGAKQSEKPYSKGKWRIKEVEKKKGMTDADVAKANEDLQFVYCHELENMWSGNEMCWEVHQVTYDKDKSKKLLSKQEYKFYREAGAETGEYIITHR